MHLGGEANEAVFREEVGEGEKRVVGVIEGEDGVEGVGVHDDKVIY